MTGRADVPLVLGGHSFIRRLGNDPKPTEARQRRLVEICLDSGITWFDTTYLPERVALGKALAVLDRRNEAYLMAWNFFRDFDDNEPLGKAERLAGPHIQQMLKISCKPITSTAWWSIPWVTHMMIASRRKLRKPGWGPGSWAGLVHGIPDRNKDRRSQTGVSTVSW